MISKSFKCPVCGIDYPSERNVKWCVEVRHPCKDAGHPAVRYEAFADSAEFFLLWQICSCEVGNTYVRLPFSAISQDVFRELFNSVKSSAQEGAEYVNKGE